MSYYTIILLSLFSINVFALEIKPYPIAEISSEQWQSYYKLVQSESGVTKQSFSEHYLEVFYDEKTHSTIAFTQVGHPAHPAWINRYVTEKNGEIYTAQIGYFAGEEVPFAKLFKQYQELTKKATKAMAEKHGWKK